LSLHLNIAVLRQHPGKRSESPEKSWNFLEVKSGNPIHRCGLLLQMDQPGLSVAWSVLCNHGPAKTDDLIQMPFGFWTRVDPRNHVLP